MSKIVRHISRTRPRIIATERAHCELSYRPKYVLVSNRLATSVEKSKLLQRMIVPIRVLHIQEWWDTQCQDTVSLVTQWTWLHAWNQLEKV